MFIPSNRIRRVDTPDAPTPGAVPPGVPPVAPPGYVAPGYVAPAAAPAAAYPAAPTAAAPGGPKKPTSKGLLIGLIAGGGVLVIAAIVAVVVLVLPAILGGGSGNSTDVADIASEPDTTWKYDWVGDNDQDVIDSAPSVVSVGDSQALVWAVFDYNSYLSTQGNSAGWYEGYDEQYDDGFAAGEEFNVARQAYLDDTYPYTVPYPDTEDYFPEGAYDDYEEWLGFQDGFYDARFDQGEGYSKKEKPVDPDYTPTLALISAVDGKEAWSIDLADAIDGADFSSQFQAYDIAGTNAVALVASVTDKEETTYVVATLDKGNGKVISSVESDGPASVSALNGKALVSTYNAEDEETTIGLYDINGLDDDAAWDAKIDGSAVVSAAEGFVIVYGYEEEEGFVLNASNGEEASWGDDIDDATGYGFVGSQLVRFEDDEIEGWNTNGDSTWKAVDAEYYKVSNGVLLTAEEDGDAYSGLMRINPSNGSEQWGDTFDDEFDYIIGVQGNSVLLADGSSIIVLDAGSGEEKFTQKAGDFYSPWLGANQYYVYSGDELAAYSYNEKGDVWTLDVDDSESIIVVGKRLALIDYDKGTIHGLGTK
jgi:hypothetical protein